MLLVQNVSKVYRLYRRPVDRLIESLPIRAQHEAREFWALRNVSFEVKRGEFLALIGPNGCGKSTLLQVVAGILQPTAGRVVTKGRVAALLELGAGFNPEFSGRENALINGELLGIDRDAMKRTMPKIEEFAGIGQFIDRPVKEYSSGMYVRLAFSIAIHVDPEILIVDEALAVGDAAFANRCIRKFHELRDRETTVLFVSHDLGLVKQLANRALFLSAGQVIATGDTKSVVDRYIATVLDTALHAEMLSQPTQFAALPRHGSRDSEILSAELLDVTGTRVSAVRAGQPVCVRVRIRVHAADTRLMAGILIRTRIGIEVYGTNTQVESLDLGRLESGDDVVVDFRLECWLTPQQYTITVASQNLDGTSHDWLDDAIVFEVHSSRQAAGVADLRAAISWTRNR